MTGMVRNGQFVFSGSRHSTWQLCLPYLQKRKRPVWPSSTRTRSGKFQREAAVHAATRRILPFSKISFRRIRAITARGYSQTATRPLGNRVKREENAVVTQRMFEVIRRRAEEVDAIYEEYLCGALYSGNDSRYSQRRFPVL